MIFTTLLLFIIDESKQSTIAAALFAAINIVICEIVYLGFFGIQIVAYDVNSGFEVYTHTDMYPIYAFFFVIMFLNIIFLWFCWKRWMEIIYNESQGKKTYAEL